MKSYKSFRTLLNAAYTSQINFEAAFNGRVHLKKGGWSDISITDEMRKELCQYIADRVGGRAATKEKVYNNLYNKNFYYWGLRQFVIDTDSSGKIKLDYCTGQDSVVEYQQIRTYIKNR